jgi:hypothetical protein
MMRKKWSYTDDIKTKEDEVKEKQKIQMQEVEKLKKDYEENHDPNISYSLSFRL